jgi:Golgi phosphoprotein 3 (GPP34)
MQAIGEDIVLLAIKRNGTIAAYEKLRFALASSELVRLAEAGRIDIDHDGYVFVVDTSPTGDALTDLALAALEDAIRPPRAREWVARQRPVLVNKYLERLAAAGTVRAEDRKVLGLFRVRRWIVLDAGRVIDAKGRLDAIAFTTGPVTSEQAAFAGLVHAIGLGVGLYPKRKDLAARDRLEAIARQDETIEMVSGAPTFPNSAVDASTSVAANAALQAATWSAIQSSVNATHHAVVQHHQTGHDGGFHDGGGGMAGGHHG